MNKRAKKIILTILFFIAMILCSKIAAGKIIYVDDDANGLNNGSSWDNAYADLQDALDDANDSEKPVEVCVAQGTYIPSEVGSFYNPKYRLRFATFQLINDVNIIGGYAGTGTKDPDKRDIEIFKTILSGDINGDDIDVNDPCDLRYEPTRIDNCYHVVTCYENIENALLDGFFITGGIGGNYKIGEYDGGLGGGMYNIGGNAKLINCTFTKNSSNLGGGLTNYQGNLILTNCIFAENSANSIVVVMGGAIFTYEGSLTLTNCTFSRNNSLRDGAAICNTRSSLILSDCDFIENSTNDGKGGGIFNSGESILKNCSFIGNIAERGGGIYNQDDNSILINCLFTGNSAEKGGGMYIESSDTDMINCTFSGNLADSGNALFFDKAINSDNSTVKLTNCIVWDSDESIEIADESSVNINFSDIYGGWPGQGNIDENPLFVDSLGQDSIEGTGDEDLRLAPISPCVDSGQVFYSPYFAESDFDGNIRIFSDNVDMGAYEFQGVIYIDDDAPYGNVPDSNVMEDGSINRPFNNIQEAIDLAKDEYKVLVIPGVYDKINFLGKAITITGIKGATVIEPKNGPVLQSFDQDAVTFYSSEDSNSVLKNFIIKNSGLAISLNYGSRPTIQNITFVDNIFGIAAYEDSNPDIRNCIFYNNTNGDLFDCKAWYSCFEGANPNNGNFDADPLFVDAANGDYHLKSEGWRWNENSESWTWDKVTSPCIDAGDPCSSLGDEPMSISRDPNNLYGINKRINIGAYGGTPQASMPPLGWIPINGNTINDIIPPSPNPAQWDVNGLPKEALLDPNNPDDFYVEIKAKTATDESGYVEYFFQCTSSSYFDSGWQSSPYYSVFVGQHGLGLHFRVIARDLYKNITLWSSEETTISYYIN